MKICTLSDSSESESILSPQAGAGVAEAEEMLSLRSSRLIWLSVIVDVGRVAVLGVDHVPGQKAPSPIATSPSTSSYISL